MNRFFSKLNLADIKIKAEGNSFPPDADEEMQDTVPEMVAVATPEVAPAELIPVQEAEPEVVTPVQDAEAAIEDASISENGNSTWQGSYEETTALYATTQIVENDVQASVTEIVSEGIVIGIGEVLKVSARSRPSAVAGAIAGVVREAGKAEVQAIGAGATNQAIKAVAIARDYLAESGIEAICVPAFIDVTIDNEDRTAIRLLVEPR